MSPKTKKTLRDLTLIGSVTVPIVGIYLLYQKIFELSFKLFSSEKLLVLIPSDTGLSLFLLGITTVVISLATIILSKHKKTKIIGMFVVILGLLIIVGGLQNYTVLTDTTIKIHNLRSDSSTEVLYSDLQAVSLLTDIRNNRASGRRTGWIPRCHIHLSFSFIQHTGEKVDVYVAPVDRQLGYSLIEILKSRNISISKTYQDSCYDPSKSSILIKEVEEIFK